MMRRDYAPAGIDTSKPSVARVYDFMIGGKDHYESDRRMAEVILKLAPDAPQVGRENRRFLRRAVRHMAAEAGIRQFLDLGSGLPTVGNVHEIAQSVTPDARTVYVDIDPIVLVHGRALLAKDPGATVIAADIREPASVLEDPKVREHIDFGEPVGLLMLGILHHFNDEEDPAGISAAYRDALAPGSHVGISHFHNPGPAHPHAAAHAVAAESIFNEHFGTGRWRRHEEILTYFGDWEMLEPGLVPTAEWRPEEGSYSEQGVTYHTFYGGVARKP